MEHMLEQEMVEVEDPSTVLLNALDIARAIRGLLDSENLEDIPFEAIGAMHSATLKGSSGHMATIGLKMTAASSPYKDTIYGPHVCPCCRVHPLRFLSWEHASRVLNVLSVPFVFSHVCC